MGVKEGYEPLQRTDSDVESLSTPDTTAQARSWRGGLLACCSGCDTPAWGSCLFSYCCAPLAFGSNMKRALNLRFGAQAAIFVLLFMSGRWLYQFQAAVVDDVCPSLPAPQPEGPGAIEPAHWHRMLLHKHDDTHEHHGHHHDDEHDDDDDEDHHKHGHHRDDHDDDDVEDDEDKESKHQEEWAAVTEDDVVGDLVRPDGPPHHPSQPGPPKMLWLLDGRALSGKPGPDGQPPLTTECRTSLYMLAIDWLILFFLSGVAVLYAASRRTQIREALGIPGSFGKDLWAWACCAPCALCQETRTLWYNNVTGGQWLGPLSQEHAASPGNQAEQCPEKPAKVVDDAPAPVKMEEGRV